MCDPKVFVDSFVFAEAQKRAAVAVCLHFPGEINDQQREAVLDKIREIIAAADLRGELRFSDLGAPDKIACAEIDIWDNCRILGMT